MIFSVIAGATKQVVPTTAEEAGSMGSNAAQELANIRLQRALLAHSSGIHILSREELEDARIERRSRMRERRERARALLKDLRPPSNVDQLEAVPPEHMDRQLSWFGSSSGSSASSSSSQTIGSARGTAILNCRRL